MPALEVMRVEHRVVACAVGNHGIERGADAVDAVALEELGLGLFAFGLLVVVAPGRAEHDNRRRRQPRHQFRQLHGLVLESVVSLHHCVDPSFV